MKRSIFAFLLVFFGLVFFAASGSAKAATIPFYELEGGFQKPEGGIIVGSGGAGGIRIMEDTTVYFTNIDNSGMDHSFQNAKIIEGNNPLFSSHGHVAQSAPWPLIFGGGGALVDTITSVSENIDTVWTLAADTLLEGWYNQFSQDGTGFGYRVGRGGGSVTGIAEWHIQPVGDYILNNFLVDGDSKWRFAISDRPIEFSKVPEPGTLALLSLVLLGMFVSKRRVVNA